MPRHRPGTPAGFTLIELMIAVAVVAILAAVALPSYNAYIQRAKVPVGLDALSAFATRMEQRYQDVGNYGVDACALTPNDVENFDLSCELQNDGQAFTATATGSGTLSGYTYTIDSTGTRKTTAHPKGKPTGNCWSTKGKTCDA